MLFQDRAPISGTHRTSAGFLAAEARISKTGIQTYMGHEVGRPELGTVRVYRGEDAVFAADAMGSAAHKPITLDHPAGSVTADRWKELAVGWTGDAVARDGEFVRVSMMIADAAAIAAIEGGTRELSCGYTCSLDWTSGSSPAGAFDARQTGLKIDHIAIVGKGRAGSSVRIGDSATAPTSIDETLRQMLAVEAARGGLTPSAYFASLSPADQRKLAQQAASTFLTLTGGAGITKDAAMNDAAVTCEVARQRWIHDDKFAFLGDKAPQFDEDRATFLARSAQANAGNAAVRDFARDAQYYPTADGQALQQRCDDARMASDPNAWRSNAAVRDLARASQY